MSLVNGSFKYLRMAKSFPDDSRQTVSVLLLTTKWQFDTHGLSIVNKSLINNLRLVDGEGVTVKIACALLQEKGKIRDEDLKGARNYGVELEGSKWLEEDAVKYHPSFRSSTRDELRIHHWTCTIHGKKMSCFEGILQK